MKAISKESDTSSLLHWLSQLSPLNVFPSSHSSPSSNKPFPHKIGAAEVVDVEVVELVDGFRLRIGGSPGAPDAKGEFAGGDRGPDASWLTAVATPGHAVDHFCFFTDDGICFSGDLILGWGSTYVPPDGGSLAAYMDSLRLVAARGPTLICPGHGPWITDPAAMVAVRCSPTSG